MPHHHVTTASRGFRAADGEFAPGAINRTVPIFALLAQSPLSRSKLTLHSCGARRPGTFVPLPCLQILSESPSRPHCAREACAPRERFAAG